MIHPAFPYLFLINFTAQFHPSQPLFQAGNFESLFDF